MSSRWLLSPSEFAYLYAISLLFKTPRHDFVSQVSFGLDILNEEIWEDDKKGIGARRMDKIAGL